MLFYSGFTRRIGDVDEGSTVTDFLPAERARGITIQSAAITFHWPPDRPGTSVDAGAGADGAAAVQQRQHTINLIDTPGHADFTFEVLRSLRVLDGAVCILDGVAGVEAQTEKVWLQANGYSIPRLIYVNKLDRDGAAFNRTVKEIASRLHTWPALCQIPWWRDGVFVGVGDAVHLKGLLWPKGGDGSSFTSYTLDELAETDEAFADEIKRARTALIEVLTEHDASMVDAFLECDEDYMAITSAAIMQSLRTCLLEGAQTITPVFAGASFRNIGVQPLLDAVVALLPSPSEAVDPEISLDGRASTLGRLLTADASQPASTRALQSLHACALAFKVVADPKRGVLVYVRVYAGSVARNALLYNTSLGVSERAPRLLRMYASEALEIGSIACGQIGVIAGLRHARTGDTLLALGGAGASSTSQKAGRPPPPPLDALQLRPIAVPPPLFFTSVEPHSLGEERGLRDGLALLLREDPSLSVALDPETGQTQLAGMGELHLEIARDRLIGDLRVRATAGAIEIGYRETVTAPSPTPRTETFDREIGGRRAEASSTASVEPADEGAVAALDPAAPHARHTALPDGNHLTILHPTLTRAGRPASPAHAPLPAELPLALALAALQSGALAALARGPAHALPLHSTRLTLTLDPAAHVRGSTTAAALSAAARLAARAALADSARAGAPALMEPVMLATIAVPDAALGAVAHDLAASRGAQVLSLDADGADEPAAAAANAAVDERRFSDERLRRVYAPPDPFGAADAGAGAESVRVRLVKARVPLKEMVGYLRQLRSLTGGRGTFVMSVDRFERMSAQRMKVVLAAMRGDVL